MSIEKWILVTDVAELRVGVTVKVTNGFNIHTGPYVQMVGILTGRRSPVPSCCFRGDTSKCVHWSWTAGQKLCSNNGILERRIYRMDTGQTDEEQQADGRKVYTNREFPVLSFKKVDG